MLLASILERSHMNRMKVLDCGMIGQCKLRKVEETFSSFEVVKKTTQSSFESTNSAQQQKDDALVDGNDKNVVAPTKTYY